SRLTTAERYLVNRRCAPLMRRLGYDTQPEAIDRKALAGVAVAYLGHLVGAVAINPRRSWIQARALAAGNRWVEWQPAASIENGEDDAPACAVVGTVRRPTVFGLHCVDAHCDVAARHLVDCAKSGIRQRVAFVNAHSLNVSVRDRELRGAFQSA